MSEAIKTPSRPLTNASHKLAEMMYAQASKENPAKARGGGGAAGGTSGSKDDDDVVDADFEEVK